MMSMGKKDKKTTARDTPDEEPSTDGAPAAAAGDMDSTAPDAAEEPAASPQPAADVAGEPSELERSKERLLRLQADFDNYRKRMARERQETVLRANEDLLAALLTPLDHLGRAIEAIQQDRPEDDAFLQGVRMVRDELLGVLDRFGLKPIEVHGEAFDPNLHEALGLVPAGGVEPGQVAVEVRRGYLLNGRVLRAAQVLVQAEGPGQPEEPSDEPSQTPADPQSGEAQAADTEPDGETETT